jgi:deoxyribonuclease-4
VFLSTPHRWQHPKHHDQQVVDFQLQAQEAAIGPNFAHAAYLINLAAVDAAIRQRSVDNLAACLDWADRAGLAGVVVHVGSGRGQPVVEAEELVADSLRQVVKRDGSSMILLENSAGSGELLGSRFSQIAGVFNRLDGDRRLGLCLDTAHTFASGYDLRAAEGIQQALDEIQSTMGLDRLRVIHANDSKVGLGSAVDRHENIGRGLLGEAAFELMLAHPALRDLAWVLEVPGYDDKGPDLPNVQALKRLAGRPVSEPMPAAGL